MEHRWREWCEHVLEPVLEGQEPQEGAVQRYGGLALVAADTDRTQDYVFESTKLPEIRGGSEKLRTLNKIELPQLLADAGLSNSCLIYAGGGGLLAFVPAAIAAQLVAEIEALYPRLTGKATITCVWREIEPSEVLHGPDGQDVSWAHVRDLRDRLVRSDWERVARSYGIHDGSVLSEQAFGQHRHFGQMVQLLGVLLRQKKDCPAVLPSIEVSPFAARCQACHIRPAQGQYVYFGEPWLLCDVCRLKVPPGVGRARETRSQQVDRLFEWLQDRPDLYARYLDGKRMEQVHYAQDLNELGAACQARPGYVGFIYADGNRMGKALEQLPDPPSYQEFSAALTDAIRKAIYQALAEHLHPALIERVSPANTPLGKGYIHPFEPLVIGGDDLMLILPADAALPVAVRIAQLFEGHMRRQVSEHVWAALPQDMQQPTLSAGVVLADSHNPVRVLQDISHTLCKSAKQRAYQELRAGRATSAIDFILLKSQSMLRRDIRRLREMPPHFYRDPGHGAGRRMTAAPYTLQEACRLLELLKRARQVDFPASQLQSLVAALQRGRRYGSIHYLYQKARFKARLGKAREDENLLAYLDEIWPYQDKQDPIPWHRVPFSKTRVYASVVPDLLELYPFVPRVPGRDLWIDVLDGGRQ